MDINTKRAILANLKQDLMANFDLNSLVLFGSQTSGSSNENSDFDILIILNNHKSNQDENQIMDICYNIDLKYNIMIDSHVLTTSELSTLRGRQPIFVNALKNGIYA